jgi:serpin B
MKLDESLTRATVTARWMDAATLRHVASRHKRRIRATLAAGVAVIAAAAFVPVLVTSTGTPNHAPTLSPALAAEGIVVGDRLKDGIQLVSNAHPIVAADPAAIGPVSTAEQALSVSLLQQLGTGTGNVSVSPASLAIALAMLQNGANSATLEEIKKTLHSSGLTTGQQNAGLAELGAQWQEAAAADGITLDSANSLFLQSDFPVEPDFLSALKFYYDAGTWQVDFAAHLSGALDTINAWTAQQTHGKIKKLFEDGQLDANTVAVLANAVYFHAAWSQPFDPHESEPGPFYAPTGTSNPTFMQQLTSTLPWATGSGYQAVQLPYKGGRFAALAIMPTTGSLPQFVAGLTPDMLSSIVAALHTGTVTVSLPKFSTSSTIDLKATLAALGMRTAFTPSADFSALSPQPTQIQAVEQRVYLKVAEKGTEAAAVSGVGAEATSAVGAANELRFDHPFLFLIRDTSTGAILFASLIQNPTT